MSEFVKIKSNTCSIAKRKLVFDVGVNDAEYIVKPTINGKRVVCPFYTKWKGMLKRCYSGKYQARQPTYIGATVFEEWLIFSNFRSWMEDKNWVGMELDKDIIVPGNKHYSPETCCFVSRAINALLNDHEADRGVCPQGVSFDKCKGKYQTYCRHNGNQKHLGYHSTLEAASMTYRTYKHALIRKIAREQNDPRIMRGLVIHADLILNGS